MAKQIKHELSAEERMATVSHAAVEALALFYERTSKTAFQITRDNWTMYITLKSYPQPLWDGFPFIKITSHKITCKLHYKNDDWTTLQDLDVLESKDELKNAVKKALRDFYLKVLYLPEELAHMQETGQLDSFQ